MPESQASPATTADELPPGVIRVPLKHPKTVDGVKCEYLDLRRPACLSLQDLLRADKLRGSNAEKEVAQFAIMAGVAPKLIKELDYADYLAVQKQVRAFYS